MGANCMASSSTSSHYTVHRCRFVDYTPAALTAIAVPPTPLPRIQKVQNAPATGNFARVPPLAIGRANGNIELYEWSGVGVTAESSSQGWVLQKILYAPTPSKIDSLIFVLRDPHAIRPGQAPTQSDLRLFSAGGGSELLEWDLERGTILRSISSQGGAIWSAAANPASTVLALGCEDGGVRLVSVANGALEHVRKFDRVKARLLSIAWGPPRPPVQRKQAAGSDSDSDDDEEEWTDSWIVAGCSDSSLRKWDCKSGRILERMTVDKNKGERTLVWAVGALGDGTIISGDSLGCVKFWDAQTCTQLQSYQLHGADVLCLAIGPEGRSVYTAGVDQKICQFSRVQVGTGGSTTQRWIHSHTRRYHVHDVRTLTTWPRYTPLPPSVKQPSQSDRIISPVLLSGGLDITLFTTPCAVLEGSARVELVNPIRTSRTCGFEDSYNCTVPYPVGDLVSLAKDARLMMLLRSRSVSIWRLSPVTKPSTDQDDMGIRALLDDELSPTPQGGWKKALEMQLNVSTNLCTGAISSDGRWLCVADMYETKLFHLSRRENKTIKPLRVKTFTSVLLSQVASAADAEVSTGATAATFSPDSSKLILALSASSYILIIDLGGAQDDFDSIRVLRKFDQHRMRDVVLSTNSSIPPGEHDSMDVDEAAPAASPSRDVEMQEESETQYEPLTARVNHAVVSPDGQWLATSDVRGRVHIYNLDAIQHHCALPSFAIPIAALVFDPSRPHTLVIALSNNTFKVYDAEARQFPMWARAICDAIPRKITGRRNPFVGACFSKATKDAAKPGLFLWAFDWFCYVELDGTVPAPMASGPKKRRRFENKSWARQPAHQEDSETTAIEKEHEEEAQEEGVNGDDAKGGNSEVEGQREESTRARRNFVVFDHYRPLLHLGFLGDGDMVVVERPFADILATLPPAYFKQKYGVS